MLSHSHASKDKVWLGWNLSFMLDKHELQMFFGDQKHKWVFYYKTVLFCFVFYLSWVNPSMSNIVLTQCPATEGCSNSQELKLNSYSNANVFFLSLCRMHISVFWGQERLTDRSISKRYLKSDIATWVEKSSTSRAIHARDTGFYWSSENALHERFIASSGVGVWMKTLQLIAKR